MKSEIATLEQHAAAIKSGEIEQVRPGMPCRITEAWSSGDCARQGDLYIVVANRVPEGYVRVDKPKAIDRQLVPGNTTGARHCLDSLDGVELWRPVTWGPESLDGPALVLKKERTIQHPTHGAVTIPAGKIVTTHYQREWDKEQAKARRAAD